MNQAQLELFKQALALWLKDRGIDKFELIFDDENEGVSGIRHNYTDAESVLNIEARKQYIINNLIDN